MPPSPTEPELSVVLAHAGRGDRRFADALAALGRGCEGINAELIVVVAEDREIPLSNSVTFTDVRVERCPPRTLTPVQWGAGARAARGRVVAFTTDDMQVAPGWGAALASAISENTVGAGGPISLTPSASGATAAAYFLRFSAFAPHVVRDGAVVPDIPGDNAAYLRTAIERHRDLLAEGFWEVEFHRRFAREGLVLRMVASANAMLAGPISFRIMIAQRFRHGTEFGYTRVKDRAESATRLIAASPFVPFVLLARTARRALGPWRDGFRFLVSLPWLSVLATAWAAGEATGAWRATRAAASST